MFCAIFLYVFYLAIEPCFVTSLESKSAFGETVRENTKATGLRLVRSVSLATSLVACNLKCLNDRGCDATNYIAQTSSSAHGAGAECQLLSHQNDNPITFEPEKDAIYTKLLKVFQDERHGNEVMSEVCDDGYSFDSTSSTCFIAPAQSASWERAQGICQKLNSTLAKVDSRTKLSFIRSITKNALYIGLKQERSGLLIWSDGSLVQRNKFINESISRSFCNTNRTCCSLLEYRGQFRTVSLKDFFQFCRTPGYFICEKKANR